MKTTTRHGGLPLLALLLLGAFAPAAPAAPAAPPPSHPAVVAPAGPAPALLADGFSFKALFSGFNSRTRVVQLCVVTMCVALFIMMRKFTGGGGR